MNLMKFFGFDAEDDDYEEDYQEDRRKKTSSGKNNTTGSAGGKLILFHGVASNNDKRKLCEEFNNGAMILIDLHELNQREFDEAGKDFITFMGGVAFARNGELKFIEPAQYLVTPRANMFEAWPDGGAHE